MAVMLPVQGGDIKIQGVLIFPANVKNLTVCSVGGRATLDITDHVGTLITLGQRGHGVKNLIIRSTNRTGTAINFAGGVPNSQLHATNILVSGVANALIFDNCHDVHDISNIELFSNGSDIEFNNNQSTSVKMRAVRMMESESSVSVNAPLADFHFLDGIIAPRPSVSMVDSCFTINSQAIFGGSVKRTRFEVKDNNSPGGLWNQMSLRGASSAFPIASFNIEDNYFTGTSADHISVNGSTRGVSISNNYFLSDPSGVDINMASSNAEDYIGPGNLAFNRELRLAYPSNLFYRARGWKAVKRTVDRHTVTISPGDETAGFVETTVTWPTPFATQTLSVNTFFRSANVELKTGTPYLTSFSRASAVLRIPVYATAGSASDLKFDVETFGY
jgi:hypothetical protein